MPNNNVSRRGLIQAGIGFAAAQTARSLPSKATLTASEVVERIRQHVGIPWRTHTVDKIVAGAEDTPVRGIATTMMATVDVLQRAAASGNNMVITHETPFYMHQDQTADLANDPTFQAKMKFIREHNLVLFHFHDHWHARHPDGIAVGMMQELGWTQHMVDAQDPHRFSFPGIPLEQFAAEIQSRLHARTMRVVGNPKLPVHHVLTSWGYISRMPGIAQFREPGVDVLIGGETREWELVEYAYDSYMLGEKKALILIGHVLSEQGGMKYCAEWLRPFIPEVPVEFTPTREPFWNPKHPVA